MDRKGVAAAGVSSHSERNAVAVQSAPLRSMHDAVSRLLKLDYGV